MANFGQFNQLELSADTIAECKLFYLTVNGVCPTLSISPATEVNKPYFNEQLRRVGKSAKQVRAGVINAEMLADGRDDDKELYPKYIIRGWVDMLDHETGKDIKFTQEVCAEFIQAIPNHVFDYIRDFAANVSSFTGTIDVETVSKN